MNHKKYWESTRVKGAYRQGRKDAIDDVKYEYGCEVTSTKECPLREEIRADVIEEIKQSFHNVYSASLYCLEDMADDCKEHGRNCDDCLYVMFNKVLEQLKEEI